MDIKNKEELFKYIQDARKKKTPHTEILADISGTEYGSFCLTEMLLHKFAPVYVPNLPKDLKSGSYTE